MARTRGRSQPALSWHQVIALILLFVVTSFSFIMLDRGRLLEPFKHAGETPAQGTSGVFASIGQRVRVTADEHQ